MNILERYVFGKAMFAFLAVLISLSGVIWIIQVLTRIDIVSTNGQTLLAYFSITLLAVPGLLLAIIPMALLMSAANVINSLNANTELVVVAASGGSNKIIVKPFLILALICSIVSGSVGHFIMPISMTALKGLVSNMNADLISLVIKEGEFNHVESGLMFHIARRNSDNSLGGILIVDNREDNSETTYIARKGIIIKTNDGNFIQLRDGQINQTNLNSGQSSTVKFSSYAIELSSISNRKKIGSVKPSEFITPDLFNPDPNNTYLKKLPNSFIIEIHERFLEMIWPFANVIVLLAFAGQARSNRQGHGNSIFVASLLLISLRGASFGAQNYANSNIAGVYVMYLLPLTGIVYGLWYLAQNQLASIPKPLRPAVTAYSIWAENTRKKWYDCYIALRRRMAF
ncbi:MAG: hypothetical protein COC17_04515 [Hyphomicrobiales bacterium]|nr:LptF/LptG family permease [Hyphomicrobiales bacterium]PCH50582.1 MAG: hypothetical protein COC17_04515 [Hyphomicrobiales bacterium]